MPSRHGSHLTTTYNARDHEEHLHHFYRDLPAKGDAALRGSRAKPQRAEAVVCSLARGVVPEELARTMAPLKGLHLSDDLKARLALSPEAPQNHWRFDLGRIDVSYRESSRSANSVNEILMRFHE